MPHIIYKKVKRSDCNLTKLTLMAELSVVLYSRIQPNKLFYEFLASSIFNVSFMYYVGNRTSYVYFFYYILSTCSTPNTYKCTEFSKCT